MATTPRALTWRYEQVFHSANALRAHGHPVNPATIRAVFNAAGVLTEDKGNQWIGDSLGAHGLHRPRDRKGNYILPDEGITPEEIVEWFAVPLGYPWDGDSEKYHPFAAALAPPSKQPGLPKQPRPRAALAEITETRRRLDSLAETLRCALCELRGVVHTLREALAEGPAVTEAEAGLRLAEQLLGAAAGLSDETAPED